MPNTKNPDMKYNDSGCRDMTAYEALRKVQREERRNLITAIKALAKERGYKIVNVIELEELEGEDYGYCASKFGIIGIVQSAAMEFAKSGIRINAVCPGVVLTPLWDNQVASYAKKRNIKPEEVMPYFESKIPMGRIGTLEEVVGVTFFLSSDDSAYLTGQSINVGGGQIM